MLSRLVLWCYAEALSAMYKRDRHGAFPGLIIDMFEVIFHHQ
jgi:hypothetical protein